jgi:hypothetical protein
VVLKLPHLLQMALETFTQNPQSSRLTIGESVRLLELEVLVMMAVLLPKA